MDLQQALADAKSAFTTAVNDANAALNRDEPKEAKRVLASGQRELRDLKRQVGEAERDMRADFQAAKLKVSSAGQVVGAFAGAKARGAMARARAMEKRSMSAKQAGIVDGYRRVKSVLDDFISQLDGLKFKVDAATPAKASGAAVRSAPVESSAPPPPPPSPAAWKADPFGRHEHRYWNGTSWTEHVSDGGVQSTDPPG